MEQSLGLNYEICQTECSRDADNYLANEHSPFYGSPFAPATFASEVAASKPRLARNLTDSQLDSDGVLPPV